jgi:predicted CopG family antitoxin
MVKQIMVRDDVYERLLRIKHDNSFSQLLSKLLDSYDGSNDDSPLALIKKQNELLAEILRELRTLNSKLSIGTPAAPTTINHATHVTPVTDENLPSYLRDNPWVSILAAKK